MRGSADSGSFDLQVQVLPFGFAQGRRCAQHDKYSARDLMTEAQVSYHLLHPDGSLRESERPGTLGGNSTLLIYGRLDCSRAIAALPLGYAKHRVFFADEDAAIAAGYRPCGRCMNEQYTIWKAGPLQNTHYPWRQTPHHPMGAPSSLA